MAQWVELVESFLNTHCVAQVFGKILNWLVCTRESSKLRFRRADREGVIKFAASFGQCLRRVVRSQNEISHRHRTIGHGVHRNKKYVRGCAPVLKKPSERGAHKKQYRCHLTVEWHQEFCERRFEPHKRRIDKLQPDERWH